MIEVTNQNFNKVYPHLEHTLKNASFIAIDGEFTGIEGDDVRNSLFDSIHERYEKNRSHIQPYIIIQFGISAFQRVHDENKYTAEAFNFFLLPRTIPSKNRHFLWQIASLEFLTMYGFDFNKLAYNGISYLDEVDRAVLTQQIQEDTLFNNVMQSISYKEEDDFKTAVTQIFEWLKTASDGVGSIKVESSTPTLQYFMHKELRKRFSNIWTYSGNNVITVIKVSPELRNILEEEEGSILENVLLESYIGFTKVFNLLVTLKKPIIAHNAFLDFMFIHQQFYKPLPQKYIDFKNNIHQLFPTIYDTKFLSFELRNILQTEEKWKDNTLSGLMSHFTGSHGKYIMPGSPVIKLTTDSDELNDIVSSKKYHTAGWDAYFTGYLFIRITHVFATKQYRQGLNSKEFTHIELMNSIKSFANCVNIIRGNTSYLRFDGSEPKSTRPKWLYVKMLSSNSVTPSQVAEKMSKFGMVDVKQCTPNRLLVAVANHGSARDILLHFKKNNELYVVPYNPIRHSSSVQLILWGSLVVSGGIFAWMLHQKFQRSS
ncbi:poly(A)-specific ribonuclease PARN-like domain-containing protein 1 isoform X1 [Mycetomoellerius zeteki]|uniref:poly(A)-specific ribonuclease PARN-like domain-containing protein 1 isoform X1 n=1 Tax=Mycetomoellerius zeteki TaxID=64791 RepID=UPI00084E9D6F|nr:PREDICTED: poly(A)-specific ribonuclease PARN-like domain-containing protein 1 isoform X1 [Trachymyrmex zeteki]XP_018302368.1 PREDICTED: poly(A)-specific ribonuclease PARN-like domain-containing protein 1 isoform X1 [Trachymyrmex zeteki]